MSQVKLVFEQRSRKRWAAYGFLLIAALTVIAWFAAPPLIKAFRGANREFAQAARDMPDLHLQIAFTLIVFVIMAAIAALIVTAASPKKVLNVKEKDLVKERDEGAKYHRMQKKRQRRLNREMREYVQKNQK